MLKEYFSIVLAAVLSLLLCFSLAADQAKSSNAFPEGIQHKYIPGNALIYTKAQVDNIVTNIHVKPTQKSYAMFIIPLNPCRMDPNQTENEVFTTFELKATTNNFTAATEWEKIVFWSISSLVDIVLESPDHAVELMPGYRVQIDAMRLYVENTLVKYNSEYAHQVFPFWNYIDSKRYQRVASSMAVSWPYYVSTYVVIVEVDMCFTHTPAEIWLKNTNDELLWTYIRGTAEGAKEVDRDGRALWRPIAPVQWFKELPRWADQDIAIEETFN